MKFKFLTLIITTIYTPVLFALDYEVVLKIKKPESSSDYPSFYDVRPDGAFIAKYPYNAGDLVDSYQTGIGIIYLPSGKNYVFKLKETAKEYNYKENKSGEFGFGQTVHVKENTLRGLSVALSTANEKGYLVDEVTELQKQTMSPIIRKFSYSNVRISKYDSNGNFVSSIDFPEQKHNSFSVSFKIQNFGQDYIYNLFSKNDFFRLNTDDSLRITWPTISTINKNIYFAQVNTDEIIFYRFTDSDLLQLPNRITLGSSQNGSITATVNNPEQALLNIQSSTNLIDWNTFKTIQNEPSLEIVVPANKPKEFIRVIE